MTFGLIAIGPPGSGKTTFCHGMSLFYRACGRNVCTLNLDPAAVCLPYPCDVDIRDLVCLEEVQAEMSLGPNGGLAYCFDYLEKNLDWLQERLAGHMAQAKYFLIDCPGQAELFMCHDSFQRITHHITNRWHINLTAVQLVDSHLCTTPHTYLSALLMCLTSMLQMELPHVNVLSKVDLLGRSSDEGVLEHTVEQLTDVEHLRHLLAADESRFATRFSKISTELCSVVEDTALLHLYPLSVDKPELVKSVADLVDQANGYALSGLAGRNPYIPQQADCASVSDTNMWGI